MLGVRFISLSLRLFLSLYFISSSRVFEVGFSRVCVCACIQYFGCTHTQIAPFMLQFTAFKTRSSALSLYIHTTIIAFMSQHSYHICIRPPLRVSQTPFSPLPKKTHFSTTHLKAARTSLHIQTSNPGPTVWCRPHDDTL